MLANHTWTFALRFSQRGLAVQQWIELFFPSTAIHCVEHPFYKFKKNPTYDYVAFLFVVAALAELRAACA